MDLLDAALAFALTIAALGTVVTVLMELMHRSIRVRKGNLIVVLQRLNAEIGKGTLGIAPQRRWDFMVNVLNNPARPSDQLPKSEDVPATPKIPSVFATPCKFDFSEQSEGQSDEDIWTRAIDSLGRRNGLRGIYDDVSLEHVLRRLVEIDEVKSSIATGRQAVETEINRIARKYEEFASAVSADFKRRAQFWSVVTGVVLALAINIDGIRIFDAYVKNKELTSRVIAQYEQFKSGAEKAQSELERAISGEESDGSAELAAQLETSQAALREKYGELDAARKGSSDASRQVLEKEIAELEAEHNELLRAQFSATEAGKAQAAMKKAAGKLTALSELGVPIGAGYFPHCVVSRWFGAAETCLEGEDQPLWGTGRKSLGVLAWAVSAILTGLLIGLGAPFWFDVAKRLSEVRGMFAGSQPTEQRLRGKDANGDSDKRRKLVEIVVKDAASESAQAVSAHEPTRDLLNRAPPKGPNRNRR